MLCATASAAAFELDRAVFVEAEARQRCPGLDAFDDDDGDAVVGVVQYAMDHGSSWQLARHAGRIRTTGS
jgi:hypothetical protein